MHDDADEIKDLLQLDNYDRFIKYSQRNEQLDVNIFCSDYHNLRKMGMERDQAALLCGVTPQRMQSLLYGIGISDEAHSKILNAEMKANAAFEKFHLSLITKHSKSDWRASGWLLERIGPKRYKPVTKVQQEVTVHDPHAATRELERLRRLQADGNNQVVGVTHGATSGASLTMGQATVVNVSITQNGQAHATDVCGASSTSDKPRLKHEFADPSIGDIAARVVENTKKQLAAIKAAKGLGTASQARQYDKLSPGKPGELPEQAGGFKSFSPPATKRIPVTQFDEDLF
jgi:hypothetical protein